MQRNFLIPIIIATLTVFLIQGCEKDQKPIQKAGINKELKFVPELNCYMPKQFFEYEHTIVKKLPDAKTMENMKIQKKSGPLGNPSIGGAIIDGGTDWAGVSGGYEEVSLELNAGWIVSGVGVVISSGSNNYVVLLLERRYIYSDGSLSARYISWDESRIYSAPGSCEAWSAVPNNCLAVGIGIKGRYDVTCLDLYYKYFNGSTNRLYGANYIIHSGSGSQGTYDNFWVPQSNYLEEFRTVLLGAGFIANSSGTAKVSIAYGILE